MSAPERGHARSQTMPVAPTIPQVTKINEENNDSDIRCAVCNSLCLRVFACISKSGYEIMLCSNACVQRYVVTNMTHASKCERVRINNTHSPARVYSPLALRPTAQESNGSQHIDLSKRARIVSSPTNEPGKKLDGKNGDDE